MAQSVRMEKTLKVLNKLVGVGVIDSYAIGGAVAAIYYIEPFDTADLDIFFSVTTQESIVLLTPIYDHLKQLGYHPRGEFVEIEDWPVQFLPAYNPLTEEALARAQQIKFGRTPTRVMRAEHLVAIMLDTGRPKDMARISMFIEQSAFDVDALLGILKRHRLMTKWKDYRKRFES